MLIVTTWFWGDKYPLEDVAKLAAGVRRHLKKPHRFVCVSDRIFMMDHVEVVPIPNFELTNIEGCFARLRMFDPEWQASALRLGRDERIVNIDLDTVITNSLDKAFSRTEDFVILQGANSVNPCKFCGAVMMVRAGKLPFLWNDFSIEAASRARYFAYPDDQGWIWHKAPWAAGWHVGKPSSIYAFCKPGWPSGYNLPVDACMVTFNGWRSPKQFQQLRWIQNNWRV